MGDYFKSIDAASINPDSTETGSSIKVDDRDTIAVQIEGDSNSTNLDIELQGKNGSQVTSTWADLDTTSFTGKDVTLNTNNSKIYLFDISGLASIRPLIRNNTASASTITVTIGVDLNN